MDRGSRSRAERVRGGEHWPPRATGRRAPWGQTRTHPTAPERGAAGERPPAPASAACRGRVSRSRRNRSERVPCGWPGGSAVHTGRAPGTGPGARGHLVPAGSRSLPCGRMGGARPEPARAPRGHRPHSVILGEPSTVLRFLRFHSGDLVTENCHRTKWFCSLHVRAKDAPWRTSGSRAESPGPPWARHWGRPSPSS